MSRPAAALLVAAVAGLFGCEGGGASGERSHTATTGSRARFAQAGDYLYAIAGDDLQLFDVSEPASPNPWARVYAGRDIETLYPHGDLLLVGGEFGVEIFDNSDRGNPHAISQFSHARSCDPVVAAGDTAYITLRSARQCRLDRGLNQLDIVDISVPTAPRLINSVAMQSPGGLAVDGEQLFVCDGAAGLKHFALGESAGTLSLREQLVDIDCFDLIATAGRLYATVDGELLQYDSSGERLRLISRLGARSD